MTPNTELSDVELSIRSQDLLSDLGCRTLADVSKLTEAQILAHPAGIKAVVGELEAVLREAGLRLRE